MFFNLSLIVSLFLLGTIVFQDFRYRAISWFLLPLLLVALYVQGMASYSLKEISTSFLLNLGFLLFQLLLLLLYFSFKERKLVNIINSKLGIGDILFFVVICVAFSPINFIVFYLAGLILTLAGVGLYHVIVRKQIGEIPLAGCVALLMIVCIVYVFFDRSFDPMSDSMAMVLTGFYE